MNTSSLPSALTLGVSSGTFPAQLAALLALQRAEEPETPILLKEVSPGDLLQGLETGRYDAGITWAIPASPTLSSQPFWRDQLAVALPALSPLLACASIPLEELLRYPMIGWCPQACEALSLQVEALIGHLDAAFTATTFELMTVLVAAGYGIGLAPRERVSQARQWGVVMRPLAEGPHWIGMSLLRLACGATPAVERFARRAERIAARGDASRSFP